MKKITVTHNDIAKIIGAWWDEAEASPEKFTKGPDRAGEDSADIFLRIAREKGIGQND
jgi:hypothetical protein